MRPNEKADEPMQHDADPALYPAMLEALEVKPNPAIPGDFAARMARMAQAQPVKRMQPQTHYGQAAAWISLLVLAVVVAVLSPATTAANPLSPTPLVLLEYILIAQMLALALWLGTRSFPGTR
jgi:hypothetical protein